MNPIPDFYTDPADVDQRVQFLETCIRDDCLRIDQGERELRRLRNPYRKALAEKRLQDLRFSLRQEIQERRALTLPEHDILYLRTAGLRFRGQHCAYCDAPIDGIALCWVWSLNGALAFFCYPSTDCHRVAVEARARNRRAELSLQVLERREVAQELAVEA